MTGFRGFEFMADRPDLIEVLERSYAEAYRIAESIGRVVGRVSRYSPVETGPGSRIMVEVDPKEYFRGEGSPVHRSGDYLVAVDPKTKRLTLLRVVSITRMDALAMIRAEPPVSQYTERFDPSTVATRTIIVAEPVVEAPHELDEDPVPAVTSIEPQAPVVEPDPPVLERLMSLPSSGILLGVLAGPWGAMDYGIPVRLPYKAVLQHVLIVGTTGSGKTTLIKNVIAAIYAGARDRRPVVLVLDLNQDYVQVPFPSESRVPDWAAEVYGRIRPPGGLVVVVPVSRYLLEYNGINVCGGYEKFYEWYAKSFIEPLLGGEEISSKDIISAVKGGLRRGTVRAAGKEIIIIPYAVNSTRSRTEEILGLLPGLSLLARDLLNRLRLKFRREMERINGYRVPYPPLPVIMASLIEYLYRRRTKGSEETERTERLLSLAMEYAIGVITTPDKIVDLDLGGYTLGEAVNTMTGILERIMPSERTVEALYRRVSRIVDSGLVDILTVCGTSMSVIEEPAWPDIIDLGRSLDYPVVVDLKPATESGLGSGEGPRAIAYRMLQQLIQWKQAEYAKRRSTPPVLVVLDEAHQFFPQEKGPSEEQEARRQVASMVSRVARLGRARGLGLLFATHSPRDLHDIIIQLANTKILLRTEKGQLERLQVPSDLARLIPVFPDRMLAVMGHSFREGYVLAMTPPPVVKHFDVSATILW